MCFRKYIGFIDSDDWIEPDMYEVLYNAMLDMDVDYVICGRYNDYPDKEPDILGPQEDGILDVSKEEFKGTICGQYAPGGIYQRLYKKEVLDAMQVWFPEKLTYEDNFFVCVSNYYINRIGLVSKPLYHYRVNSSSIIQSRNASHHCDRLTIEIMKVAEFKKRGLFEVYKEDIERNFLELYFVNTVLMLAKRFDELPEGIITEMQSTVKEYFPNWRENILLQYYTNEDMRIVCELIDWPFAITCKEELLKAVQCMGNLFQYGIVDCKDEKHKMIALMEQLDQEESSDKYELCLKTLVESTQLDWSEKYYILWQIIVRLFARRELENETITKLLYKSYDMIGKDFASEFDAPCAIDGYEDNLVLVTVQQFVGLRHAPTKITLDRARVLQKRLGKKVIIINTAEYMGGTKIGLLHERKGAYKEELLSAERIEYQGTTIPFIQFYNNMPNVNDAQVFFAFIKKHRPAYIVNIGGDSLLIDECSKLIPVLNINTVASEVARTKATAQVMGRKLTNKDNELLNLLGKTEKDVIIGRFTLSLQEQTKHYTREEVGIPEERFVIAVVGTRLTSEMSPSFVVMLDEILKQGAVLVIIGEMKNYEYVCSQDPIFKENSIYLGIREDILADLELCDLYVNPDRKGGGTSGVAALYKGCPVVTLKNGDVALGVGEAFCVENYTEMQEQIMRYMTDKKYYEEMSAKARERADYMLDSEGAFSEIIDVFEKRYLN